MATEWSYEDAFSRNRGLISTEEQQRLRASRVAVLGLGGVGGVNLITLARLGIGKFTIADPDVFEIHNSNRQYGAMVSTYGRSKAEVMRELVLDINPEAEIRVFDEPIGETNADHFLEGADILVDGIDAFVIDVRRLLFRKARKLGIHALGAGPVGYSTAWVIFGPQGMTFDRYFDLHDHMDAVESFAAYVVGMAPAGIHRAYMDLSYLDFDRHVGPSVGFACQLAAGVIGAEVMKILLGRGRIHCAPFHHQFDPYLGRYIRRKLLGGNRHPLQRIKRRWLVRYLKKKSDRTGNQSKGV